jgi:hypothetical protein
LKNSDSEHLPTANDNLKSLNEKFKEEINLNVSLRNFANDFYMAAKTELTRLHIEDSFFVDANEFFNDPQADRPSLQRNAPV